MEYIFSVGQRVSDGRRTGEVTGMVPGNGRPESEWYYVAWDDGDRDRHQRDQIYAA